MQTLSVFDTKYEQSSFWKWRCLSEQGLMQVCLYLVLSIRIRNILDNAVL